MNGERMNEIGFIALDMGSEKMRCSICGNILEGCRRINEKEADEEATPKEETLLGNRIAKYLAERNISQRQFAARIEMTEVSVSRYVNNERLPNANVIMRMAKALHITTDELLGMNEEQS